MENSKKIYILKSTVTKAITKVTWILWISISIFLFYPQYMCKSSEILVYKKVDISEKLINKNLDYLKEDIKLPIFVGGKNKISIQNINNKINTDIMGKAIEAENAAKEQFSDIKERPTFPYEIKSFYIVTDKNDSIISLYNDYYEYLGGAHGSTIRTGYTIDRISEKIISLKDLFLDGFDYKGLINEKIKEEIRKEPGKFFYSPENFEGITDNQGFYISNSNLIIFFNQYEIAPYAAGIPEFKIPIKEFGDNFYIHIID